MERGIAWSRWARIRTAAFIRDGYKCQSCGKTDRLEAHHIKSVEHGGKHEVNNLRALCVKCHLLLHRPGQLRARDERMTPAQREWDRLAKEL